MTSRTKPESAAHITTSGPGAQLAQARADLHLTQEAVATKLHLSTLQIKALEQDDYTRLPGSTYVRGYLKSYAMLLGISPEKILETHSRMTAAPTAVEFSVIAPQKEITSRHHQVRFVTYIMVAIVVGLAIAWWQGRNTRTASPLLTMGNSESALPATEVAPGTDQQAGTGMLSIETPVIPAPAANSVTTTIPSVTTISPQNQAVVASPPVPATQPPVPAHEHIVLPTGPRMTLVLTAEQDSWADIRDARQTKLLYETVPAGRTVTLEGVAPVNVFLGNAAGVRLDYNGKSVDVASHKRGMVARFTLGESEAAKSPVR